MAAARLSPASSVCEIQQPRTRTRVQTRSVGVLRTERDDRAGRQREREGGMEGWGRERENYNCCKFIHIFIYWSQVSVTRQLKRKILSTIKQEFKFILIYPFIRK